MHTRHIYRIISSDTEVLDSILYDVQVLGHADMYHTRLDLFTTGWVLDLDTAHSQHSYYVIKYGEYLESAMGQYFI
jgi:hypothetical protein